MQKPVGHCFWSGVGILLLMSLFWVASAHASGHGGGGEGGGSSAYEKLEPFTVNLVGLHQILQVALTLKLSKPESGEKVKFYMPVIRHEMILLLSDKTADQVQSPEGKLKLIQETKLAVNKAIELDEKEGVSDVLFDSFIIQ